MASFLFPIVAPAPYRRPITHSTSRRPLLSAMGTPQAARFERQGMLDVPNLHRAQLNTTCDAFSHQNAYILGVLSDAVYGELNAERLLSVARSLDGGFTTVRPFSVRNTQGAIFEHESCIAVIWRGSDTSDLIGNDWYDNIDYALTDEAYHVDGLPVRFHLGFWRHVGQAWEDQVDRDTGESREGVGSTLRQLQEQRRRKVLFSGHSLGGSAAILAAVRFLLDVGHMDDLGQIITFGQPQSVHAEHAEELLSQRLGSRYFRFVNETDLVPHLPISRKYSHGGTLKFVTIDKNIITNPWAATVMFRKFASFVINLSKMKFSVAGDHDVKLYWDAALNGNYNQ